MNITIQQAEERLVQLEKEKAELQKIISTSQKDKEKVFRDMWTGCTVMPYDEKYPDSVFYFKGDKYFFEIENSKLWCSRENVWGVFESKYGMPHDEIKNFIAVQVEKHFKMKELTPAKKYIDSIIRWRSTLK